MGKNYFGIVKIDFNLKNIPSDDKPLFNFDPIAFYDNNAKKNQMRQR